MTSRENISLTPSLRQWLRREPHHSDSHESEFGVVFSYVGLVDGDLIPHLVQVTERALQYSERTRKEVKRATSVMIEAVQNVLHHGHIDDRGETSLHLTLEHTPLGYQWHCGNFMEADQADALLNRIGDLNNLSHAELRKRYIEVLCSGTQDTTFGNAGLGLISMAKRTQGPIEFASTPHPSGLHLVTLTATIKR